jgi:hypothetical protein
MHHGVVIDEEEAALLPDLLERGTTVFHRLPGGDPALMNYHVMGFFKEAAKALNGKVTGGVRNLRYMVSAYITVTPASCPCICLPAPSSTTSSVPCAPRLPPARV